MPTVEFYGEIVNCLEGCFSADEITTLCLMLHLPKGNVVIPGEPIRSSANRLLLLAKQGQQIKDLIKAIKQQKPLCNECNETITLLQSQRKVAVCLTPDVQDLPGVKRVLARYNVDALREDLDTRGSSQEVM